MWDIRSHLIKSLTSITSDKVTLEMTDVEHKTFEDIKHIVARDTLLEYLDFNERFDIRKDTSEYQLGPIIIQYDKPIAFYICKLTGTQIRYTVT